MKLDLGGIAKGYACGEAIAVLSASGITSALVAGAGDIVVSDPPPDAAGWTIGIAPLEAPSAPPRQFLRLKDAAVSTSGDAERFVEIDGKRYSHIVDPQTGLGVVDRSQRHRRRPRRRDRRQPRHGGLRPRPRARTGAGRGHRGGRGPDRPVRRRARPRHTPPGGSRSS